MSRNLPELPKSSQATYARLSKVAEDYISAHCLLACDPIGANERAALGLSMRTMAQELRDGCHADPRAMARILSELQDAQDRTEAPESNRAKARAALASLLSDELGRVKYAPGSGYRTAANPNPNGLTVENIEQIGRFNDHPRLLPGLNVKAYPDLSGIDWIGLRNELGLDEGTLAPTGRYVDANGAVCEDSDEGAKPELLPFGRAWIEARYDLNGRDYARQSELSEGPESWARESAWEFGKERAEALFGKGGLGYRVRVEGRGRCGGYFCLAGLPDMHELAEGADEYRAAQADEAKARRELAQALGLAETVSADELELTAQADTREDVAELLASWEDERENVRTHEHADSADTLAELLGAWSELADDAKATVADLGRSTAWHCGANVFQSEAEEYAREEAERLAEETRSADLERWAQFGRDAARIIQERGHSREKPRAPLYDALARDGFRELAALARERGLVTGKGTGSPHAPTTEDGTRLDPRGPAPLEDRE